jgi:translation elongation factor EF-Ts
VGCETEPVSNTTFAQRCSGCPAREDAVAELDAERVYHRQARENIRSSAPGVVNGAVLSGYAIRQNRSASSLEGTLAGSAGDAHLVRPAEVPAELVSTEREILLKQPDVESKPADVRERIVEGMLNKRFYAESVLGEQTWIHDNALNVAKALEQSGFELVDYAWYSVR